MEQRLLFAIFAVNNANDSGAFSLRQAIIDSNAATTADTILFDPGFFATPRTISLLTALPTITGSGATPALTITGAARDLSRCVVIQRRRRSSAFSTRSIQV